MVQGGELDGFKVEPAQPAFLEFLKEVLRILSRIIFCEFFVKLI
jgi:hypothetical protein